MSLKSHAARAAIAAAALALTIGPATAAAADTTPPSTPAYGEADGPGCGPAPSSVTVTWTPSVDEPGGSGLKGYWVRWGGDRELFVGAADGETATLTDLGAGGLGLVRVSAVDVAGNESPAREFYQTVANCLPLKVTALVASEITSSSVGLSWSAVTDSNGTVAKYRVYNGSTLAKEVTGTSAIISGLSANTEYTFTVAAVDDDGSQGPLSDSIKVKTRQLDTTAPTKPAWGDSDWPVCGPTPSSATITWQPSTDEAGGSGLKGYRVRWRGQELFVGADAGEEALLTGLGGTGGPGNVTVTAVDNAGNESAALVIYQAVAICLDLQKVTGVKATAVTADSVTLSWDAPTNPYTTIKEYRVYESGELLKVATGLTATITGLGPGTDYEFTVVAVDTAGNTGPPSDALHVTTRFIDTSRPTIPQQLRAERVSDTSVKLTWVASTDDVGVSAYVVSNGGGAPIATVGGTTTSYIVNGLQSHTISTFGVAARDAAGNISQQATVTYDGGPIIDDFWDDYRVAGTGTLKTLVKGSFPLKGSLRLWSHGSPDAELALDDTTGRLTALGFLPITARIGFVPSGKGTAAAQDGRLRVSSRVRIKVKEVKLFGAIPLAGGNNCQTKELTQLDLATPADRRFTPQDPGVLSGTFAISNLNGCGALNGLVSPVTAGKGNTISLTPTFLG